MSRYDPTAILYNFSIALINCNLSYHRGSEGNIEMQEEKKIMIVEDEMIIAADLSMQLTKRGYSVIGMHTTGVEAIEAISVNEPDIILMDISLDGKMDGIEAAGAISKISKSPIIFLTSNTDDVTFQRALTTKPFGFIGKPFRIGELERSIKLALKLVD